MDRHNLSTSSFKEVIIFILKLLVFALLVAGFLLIVSPRYLQNYQAGLLDKVERLENIDGPKIVLLANSNAAFGIESEEIEDAFGMPVVNMGLHGGLGNAFHERMARFNVHEGDIYIICHSSYAYEESTDRLLAWITIEDHFKLWKLLGREDIRPMLQTYPVYLKRCISLWLTGSEDQGEGVYQRAAFNKYGDIEWEDNGLEHEFTAGEVQLAQISDRVAERINELNEYLNERGAVLLLAGYPIADTPDRPSDEEYAVFGKELAEKMDAPVISDYLEYIYPMDYFFDTCLHLNCMGKKVRTRQLIEDLNEWKTIGNQNI